MKALNELTLFAETAKQGSFSKVANQMDMTPAAVSASIKRLEEQIGFPLFVRSTRRLSLTGEGELFLTKVNCALATLHEGVEEIANARGALTGNIYVSAPSDFGRNLLLDWINEFTDLHENVTVRLELSDQLVDMYSKPIDIAIRYGELPDSNMVAIPLCLQNVRVLCASPDYIRHHPPVLHPNDLNQHNCISFMVAGSVHNLWPLSYDLQQVVVETKGAISANDGDVVRRLGLKGRGIVNKSLIDASQDIIEGKLRKVLPDWQGESVPLYMVCADKRQLRPIIREFQKFLKEKCQSQFDKVSDILNN
ncbi:LysR substrate-binding domain-containing protein [Vibrio ruber]|uniref:LysR family transcriptional regulator n=1 Tax=Vibrio ruber TaxID=184755 RepID=UPI0028932169|nr:LysR substrate-binding domain-containing protein [Vibrio ruber]WNJ97659.1 LysR substrate-binding domain-containing protein [Vibrio ruber]